MNFEFVHKKVKNFQEKSEFVQITSFGMIESHPHDMDITKDSPNYRKINLKYAESKI